MSDRQDGAARYGVDSKAQWEIHDETNAGTGGYKAMEQLWEFGVPPMVWPPPTRSLQPIPCGICTN